MQSTAGPGAEARRAGPADAPALVRLRGVMFEGTGLAAGGDGASWRADAETWFHEKLRQPAVFAAFVVDDPVLGVVSVACGLCDARPPGPRSASGVRGHVFGVATDARCRRRGHARACLEALLSWFSRETRADVVELTASDEGIALYRSLGFREREHPAMRLALRGRTEAVL